MVARELFKGVPAIRPVQARPFVAHPTPNSVAYDEAAGRLRTTPEAACVFMERACLFHRHWVDQCERLSEQAGDEREFAQWQKGAAEHQLIARSLDQALSAYAGLRDRTEIDNQIIGDVLRILGSDEIWERCYERKITEAVRA